MWLINYFKIQLNLKTIISFVVLLLCFSLVSPIKSYSQSQITEYTLGSGDKVKVTVFGEDDLSGEYEIGGSGFISVYLVGEVRAIGLSERGLEGAIVTKLKEGYLVNPRVSVEVLNYRPFYILGEVDQPGSYPFVNGMTVINAIAMGGGFTYRADEEKIYITRAGNENQEKIESTIETIVLPGDVIKVEERFF